MDVGSGTGPFVNSNELLLAVESSMQPPIEQLVALPPLPIVPAAPLVMYDIITVPTGKPEIPLKENRGSVDPQEAPLQVPEVPPKFTFPKFAV